MDSWFPARALEWQVTDSTDALENGVVQVRALWAGRDRELQRSSSPSPQDRQIFFCVLSQNATTILLCPGWNAPGESEYWVECPRRK